MDVYYCLECVWMAVQDEQWRNSTFSPKRPGLA